MDRKKVKEMIEKSLKRLVENDSNIFKENNNDNDIGIEYSLDRKLHEIAINHRFAVYLEHYLIKNKIEKYSVDIEYNRNFSNPKELNIDNEKTIVRPDILIHQRQDVKRKKNLLIIEAKKGDSPEFDKKKIKAFMNDINYNYQFGLAVSYCSNKKNIICAFFSKDKKNTISEEKISIKK